VKEISMATTTVSVIVPAYNSAQTIATCLDSIAAQTHPVCEIIVVDDCSGDDTVQQAGRWSSNHAQTVQIITQPRNGGPAAARNAGVAAATSEWIAFLDADDAWLPWRLETQFALLARNPTTIFCCAQTADLETTPADGSGVHRPPSLQPCKLDLRQFLAHNPVATSTVLVRRDVIEACGGFDTSFRGPEDYDLWLRIVTAYDSLYLPAILSRYRTTVGSLSMDERNFLPEVLRVLDKAFAPGGALAHYRHLRYRAMAEQYTAASWMAYNRGDRKRALALLIRSWLCGPTRLVKERKDPLQRVKLLLRYLQEKN